MKNSKSIKIGVSKNINFLSRIPSVYFQTKLIAIALIAFVFISCSSDDDETEQVSIVETWKLISLTSQNNYDFNEDGIDSNDLILELNCHPNQTLVFKSNGTGTQETQNYPLAFYDTVALEYTTQCLLSSDFGIDDFREITWSQNGNNRSFAVIGGENLTGTVTNSQLIITIPNGFAITDEVGEIYSQETVTSVYELQ